MAASSSSEAGAGSAAGTILKNRSISPPFDLARAMRVAQAASGVGAFRQVRLALALAWGPGRVTPREFYEYALFRPHLTEADRRAFVGFGRQQQLNLRLSPDRLRSLHGLCADKLLCALVLDRAGLPTPPTLALYRRGAALPGLTCLDRPEALARWLLEAAPLPVFGKPLDGSLGIGAVAILDREGDALVLGDGRRVPAAALAAEVARDYASGWQVQPLLRLHPDVAELAGRAVAMLRVVTLRGPQGPEPLYALLRLPAKDAMIDTNQPHAPNGYVAVDPQTGALGRAQSNWETNLTPLAVSTATGVPLAGRRLPFVPEACRLCETAHRLFMSHGILGFDIALTPEGPVIGEVNSLPHHNGWQRAADRGLMNADFAPRIAAAMAETARRGKVAAAELERIAGRRLRRSRL
ncbi:MAG: hypothetical protein N2Z62_06475 [Rhodobacteraceae bacterium]|nr:hypothetical protein [Paracoccaceae bacterium]